MTREEKDNLMIHLDELRLEKSNTDDFGEQMEIAGQIHK